MTSNDEHDDDISDMWDSRPHTHHHDSHTVHDCICNPTRSPQRSPLPIEGGDEESDTNVNNQSRISLFDLVSLVTAELSSVGKGQPYQLSRLHHLMSSYDAALNEWRRFAFFDERKLFTRNLVATDNETFTLMLLCWNPHKSSPVHDHAGSDCFMRIVDGQIIETQYRPPVPTEDREKDVPVSDSDITECLSMQPPRRRHSESALVVSRRIVADSGAVRYINDEIGLHKVENALTTRAVTLHLYIPPYNSCDVYDETTSSKQRAFVTFYSENGQINECN